MLKKKYNDIVREKFVCRDTTSPVDTEACDALLDCFRIINIPSFYKFMSLKSEYTMSNIENDVFHFSRIDQLNDPFEFANIIDVELEKERRKEALKYVVFIEEPTEEEIEEFVNPTSAQKVMNEIKGYTFVYSLTTSFDNAPMWYSYAGDYNGICVEYDSIELFRKYNWRLTPIEYVDQVPTSEYGIDTDSILKFIHRSCTTKSIKWRDEDEWRITKIEYVNKTKILNETMSPKSITVGKNVSVEDKERLWKLCREKGIPLYEIEISEGTYSLSRKLVQGEVGNVVKSKPSIWTRIFKRIGQNEIR